MANHLGRSGKPKIVVSPLNPGPAIASQSQERRLQAPLLRSGYPLESVIAEKADTMMFLGDGNTRDRDYGDVYLLSQIRPVGAESLRDALRSVAVHRGH